MRPVDIDVLYKVLTKMWDVDDDQDFANKDVWHALEDAPTLDVKPVVHGKWIPGKELAREYLGGELIALVNEDWHCSECGFTLGDYGFGRFCLREGKPFFDYCPHCGAMMDNGAE